MVDVADTRDPGAEPAQPSTAVTGAGVQSVDRALGILEVLARTGESGVTEIALELGVHKSTAFRLVATLEAHRLVEQTADRGRYRLGVGILRLAGATTARLDLVQEARPIARQLAVDTGETVNIAVLSESSALYLDQVAGSSALQPHNWVGQHIPLHATSNGKVLLGGLDDDDLHLAHDHRPPGAAGGAGAGAPAGLRRRGRRAGGRADGGRRPHPQRAR
jgi:DNA-binding IclR family transcriptional regulator